MLLNNRISISKDLLAGIGRGVDFKIHTYLSAGMKPTFLHIEVTSRCNARCSICNIWRSDSKNDLKINELESIFSSPLLSNLRAIAISGGEPFLRNDLSAVFDLIHQKLMKIQEIKVNTNGLMTNRIISQTEKALEIFDKKIKFRIGISFDGLGDEHDRLRNIQGIHNAALATARGLHSIGDKRLQVQAHIVIGPHNMGHLEEMYYFYRNIFEKINWFPVIVSDCYYKNEEKADELSFDSITKDKVKEFFKGLVKEDATSPSCYYYSRLIELWEKNKRTFPCTGGYRYMEIDAEGNVKPCQYVPKNLYFGNIKEKALEEIWLSKEANAKRKKLKKLPTCKNCTSNCDMFSIVRDAFFDFIFFLMTHPKILVKISRKYIFKIS